MDSWLLTPEEINRVILLCDHEFTPDELDQEIARAQADKMIREGFIRRDDFQRQIDATDYTVSLIRQAREDALREVGSWLDEQMKQDDWSFAIQFAVKDFKSGRMPEGTP